MAHTENLKSIESDPIDPKLGIVELLETNIREFSERLAMMHRSVRLQLVWNNPDAR